MKKIIYATKNCQLCQEQFQIKKTCKKDFKRKFCSKKCSSVFNGKNNKGRKHTEEWKQNLREKNSGENNPFYGKQHCSETKEKISKSNKSKGRKHTEEWKQNLREKNSGENNPFYGKKHTDESRAKISQNHADHSGEKNPNYANGDKIKGEKNPGWLGGISYGEYGLEFNQELKKSIRKRDFFKCKICKKNGYDVHHIDYDKKNNLSENLITLCRSCHMKTNFNRESWKSFFKTTKEENTCQHNE
jgi:hypothetical protein